MEAWRRDALRAVDDARREIEAATEATFALVITVSEADLLGDMPVTFGSNLNPDFLGPFMGHCAARWTTARATRQDKGE